MPTPRRGLLRPAAESDFPRLYQIWSSVDEHRFREDWERFVETATGMLAGSRVWVWSDGAQVHGFAAADPVSAEIAAVYVHPKSQGRGIGRALLRKCCDGLMKRGHRHAWLVTSPGTRAERIYRDAGWQEAGIEASGAIKLRKRLVA